MAHLEPSTGKCGDKEGSILPLFLLIKPLILQPAYSQNLLESPTQSKRCRQQMDLPPSWLLAEAWPEPSGEKAAKPGSDCSRLLLQSLRRGKERRGAGTSNSRLPTCTVPAGLGTALGPGISGTCIPGDVRGPRAHPPTTPSPAWRAWATAWRRKPRSSTTGQRWWLLESNWGRRWWGPSPGCF